MDYIESEMRKRSMKGAGEPRADLERRVQNPADELFGVAEKYRRLQEEAQQLVPTKRSKPSSEGGSTLSAAMLSKVPEVDLGGK